MIGKRMKNLYNLIGKIILGGAMKVESHHEMSFTSSKEVVEVDGCHKMIKILFFTKCTH